MSEFRDFTLQETLLFGETIGEPFSDFPQVFRSVITDMTFTLAQGTQSDWFTDYAAEYGGLVGEAKIVWREKMLKRLKKGDLVVALNLCDWTEDVVAESGEDSGLALRRRVSDELRLESDSVGECTRWLAFFGWVVARRESLDEGKAFQSWVDYIKDTPFDIASSAGLTAFLAWIAGRIKQGSDDDGEQPSDSPLEEDTSTHNGVAAAAV